MQLVQAEQQKSKSESVRPEGVELFASWYTGWTRFLFGSADKGREVVEQSNRHTGCAFGIAPGSIQSTDLCVVAGLSRGARRPLRRTLKYLRSRKHL